MVVDFYAYGFSFGLDFAPIRSNRVCLLKEKIYHAADIENVDVHAERTGRIGDVQNPVLLATVRSALGGAAHLVMGEFEL